MSKHGKRYFNALKKAPKKEVTLEEAVKFVKDNAGAKFDETVKINDGAFMGLTGQVSMVDPDKGKLKVEVAVFGRKVPVDVEYWQVEKVPIEDTLEPLK